MRLVVGLGNPERKYQDTRHNLGFRVCDELARRMAVDFDREKFHSRVAEAPAPGGDKVMLLEPLTYMNRSGQAVAAARRFFQLDFEDMLVVCDDFNLDLGRLRIRPSGSHGGHNGLRDIIARLGDDGFPRLRLGIGPLGGADPVGFCLTSFRPDERDEAERMVIRGADAVEAWLGEGIDAARNRFNGAPQTDAQETDDA